MQTGSVSAASSRRRLHLAVLWAITTTLFGVTWWIQGGVLHLVAALVAIVVLIGMCSR